ncbi:transporter substrate-binding domain-containing protein [Paracoccus tibetensis]|uniref:Amino acid ABC transporter substrate-binding protein, PAAT family n=1 Tax=Paracoccus tibetensis TaxID=336292 RepID=A0A1G5C1H9_9RHOB|nr:transporter substrate-binding domain-containing protein [Paracoccus tibetensis]SCX96305.1 amino acid ABC transporter substrate-binding protein, PAAT family [Paracoccus tibetensis]
MKTLTLAAAALAVTAGLASAQQTIRMGTEGAYPPYNFIDDASGQVTGFEIELGNALCERAGLTCTWVRNDWDSIIPNLVSGNYDTIMAGMNINEERQQVIQFTQPYTPAMPSAYAALSADVDVEGGIVAAQTNTIQAGHVAETGATLLEFPNPDQTVAAVRNGEADAVFADKDFLAPIVEESGGELVWVEGFDTVPLGEGIGMGLRQSDTELREQFDTAITAMKEDGSLNELIVKWFGEDALTFE